MPLLLGGLVEDIKSESKRRLPVAVSLMVSESIVLNVPLKVEWEIVIPEANWAVPSEAGPRNVTPKISENVPPPGSAEPCVAFHARSMFREGLLKIPPSSTVTSPVTSLKVTFLAKGTTPPSKRRAGSLKSSGPKF